MGKIAYLLFLYTADINELGKVLYLSAIFSLLISPISLLDHTFRRFSGSVVASKQENDIRSLLLTKLIFCFSIAILFLQIDFDSNFSIFLIILIVIKVTILCLQESLNEYLALLGAHKKITSTIAVTGLLKIIIVLINIKIYNSSLYIFLCSEIFLSLIVCLSLKRVIKLNLYWPDLNKYGIVECKRFKNFGLFYFLEILFGKLKQEAFNIILGYLGSFDLLVTYQKVKYGFDIVHNGIFSTYKKIFPLYLKLNKKTLVYDVTKINQVHFLSLSVRVLFFLALLTFVVNFHTVYLNIPNIDLFIKYGLYSIILQSLIFTNSTLIFELEKNRDIWFLPLARSISFLVFALFLMLSDVESYYVLTFVFTDVFYLILCLATVGFTQRFKKLCSLQLLIGVVIMASLWHL